ncbi:MULTISPECIES: flagellar basal body P-ring formation chaperone FlgA [Haematobacter]|uniref:Flagella basal body P-ring formation protein FlgA n=1 Tax=Haematobacter genomosp. 1 TaxID=366618 RepID=A0A212AGP6_9RHOB|nr:MULTISPECIES: flagellar basal body P-ring formation chaperone FlgA [Haematobacter]OWJ80678.1 flagella basal body P-ring formation protein FlgA [Haematobacter genomosp. 1]
MRLAVFLLLAASPAGAEALVAAHTIRATSVIAPTDLALSAEVVPGALTDPGDAIGFEARVAIYAGRPIRPGDIAPAAVVERNQIVPLAWRKGGLLIRAEGRALGRAAPGEDVRVLNLASRTTVTGIAGPDGTVHVGGTPKDYTQ